jgi:hypothetical protein
MARNYADDKLRSKKTEEVEYPSVFFDKEHDFASIKIAPGVENRSYEKDGFIFFENKKGEIIEVQVLNLSELKAAKRGRSA